MGDGSINDDWIFSSLFRLLCFFNDYKIFRNFRAIPRYLLRQGRPTQVGFTADPKANNLLCKVNFFPPKFPFPKYKRKIWREKNYFANERGPSQKIN
jgi:hypothetical protein